MKYINYAKAYLGHILYYLQPSGRTILPSSIVLELTNRCNLRCRMCWWNFEEHQVEGSKELVLDEVRELIDDLANFMPRLVLTGSELLLRKDIIEIIEYIYEKNFIVDCIMTNGTLMTENIAKAIVKIRPGIIQFSIDGDENVHDHIRGMKGAYQRTIRGMELLGSAMENRNETGIAIRLNCVILPQNIHCIDSVAKLAGELGVQLQFQYLMWLDQDRISAHESFLRNRLGFKDNIIRNLYNNLDGLHLKMLDEQLTEVKKFCNETGIPLYFMQFSDHMMIEKWYSDLNFKPRRKCIEPFLVSRIGAEGSVKFCPLIDYSYGNVKEIPFNVLWNNQRALKIRSLLKKERLFPGCIRCCKL